MKRTDIIPTIFKGGLLGIANIIPGVSGGTMALVLGIYERLIKSLNSIDVGFIKTALGVATFKPGSFDKLKAELNRIDFWFIVSLGIGAVLAILASSRLIIYLLTEHHDPTYGFFLGLILVSIIVPCKMFKKFGAKELVMILLAAGLTLGVTNSMSGEENLANAQKKHAMKEAKAKGVDAAVAGSESIDTAKLGWLFVSAAIAISAMILPGISGSFLMILMGVYFDILEAIARFDLIVLAVFAAGIGVGLLLFARLLNFVFDNYYDLTIGFLVGLMFGSLYGLWPFKNFEMVGTKRVDLEHIIPAFDGNFYTTVVAFLVGCALVGIMLRFEK